MSSSDTSFSENPYICSRKNKITYALFFNGGIRFENDVFCRQGVGFERGEIHFPVAGGEMVVIVVFNIVEVHAGERFGVKAVFRANPSDLGDYSGRYTWYFIDTANQDTLFTRQMEETDFTFQNSGSFMVYLKATFVLGTDTIQYPEEGEEGTRFSVSIAESHLEMPNAFSPGDEDDINKIYKAKSNHQSIVEFKATIFNRWGQKLYSWTDINGGWDGKVNGRVVKNGVYFVNVVAKGADGRVYHIRKDVNVLTHYTEASDNSGGTEQ